MYSENTMECKTVLELSTCQQACQTPGASSSPFRSPKGSARNPVEVGKEEEEEEEL